jgi:hypothetical protein
MDDESVAQWDISCPPPLRDAEAESLKIRRIQAARQPPEPDYADAVGVALSGGGIRSATFALGVFQGLARLRLLDRIDFLSTVSGGGYFGGFYGRLMSRDTTAEAAALGIKDVEILLDPESQGANGGMAARGRHILRWLRENGRYLAPTGSGDYLTALAVILRNWGAVTTIVMLSLLMVFLALRIGLATLLVLIPAFSGSEHLAFRLELLSWPVWLSPLLIACGVLSVLVLPALAWAYWIAALYRQAPSGRFAALGTSPFVAPLAVFILAAFSVGFRQYLWADVSYIVVPLSVVAVLAILLWRVAASGLDKSGHLDATDHWHDVAKRLSDWLRIWLVVAALLGILGVIDTLGQSIYALGTISRFTYWHWLVGMGGGLVTLVASGQKIAVKLSTSGKAWIPSVRVIAGVAALLLVFVIACGMDYAAQAIVWRGGQPSSMPAALQTWAAEQRCLEGLANCKAHKGCTAATGACPLPLPFTPRPVTKLDSPSQLIVPASSLGVLTLLAFLIGMQWPFVNLSTLLPLYAARLSRAYLGASNPARQQGAGMSVVDPIPGDDLDGQEYFAGKAAPWHRGGPIHVVNVTINETIDGRSQIQQRDRHGVGMAVSRAGMSVGIRSHRLWDATIGETSGYRVFGNTGDIPEKLALSQWLGISGAAVSTGMGFQSSFGLSILMGVLNVRLGYWWNSGTSRKVLSSILFSVQRFLVLNEWLGRFPGTAQSHWYLSDGGHFENTAAYELIRRRLPLIIVSDAGADPTYRFDDLANLVRKARIDFDTEITFVEPEELARSGQDALGLTARYFGSLAELDPLTKLVATTTQLTLPRIPCAALARIRYPGNSRLGWLIVLKPVLHPEDPPDLVNYGKLNETFPNQTTADQFFDEAQWESYRKLGELIALRVFARNPAGPYNKIGDSGPMKLLW